MGPFTHISVTKNVMESECVTTLGITRVSSGGSPTHMVNNGQIIRDLEAKDAVEAEQRPKLDETGCRVSLVKGNKLPKD